MLRLLTPLVVIPALLANGLDVLLLKPFIWVADENPLLDEKTLFAVTDPLTFPFVFEKSGMPKGSGEVKNGSEPKISDDDEFPLPLDPLT